MAKVAKRRGRYILDFYDNNGKRRWQTLREGTTLKQAKDKLREVENQLARGTHIPDKKVPTFSKVADDWLDYKKPNVRSSTWRKYKGYVENRYKDLNDLKINRITIATIEKYISTQQSEGVNLNTFRKVLVVLNQILSYAVRHRYIDFNPVREAEKPRDNGEIPEHKIKILEPSNIAFLLNAEKDKKYRTLFSLAVTSGAREGELFGLKWTDIDWFNNQIHIQRTYNEGDWHQPKSKASNRKIDIGPLMIAELKNWNKVCPANELGLVFPNENGGPLHYSNMLRRHFNPALVKAKLPKMRFHDLRHTYASLLIEQGENIKYIQSQMGHASPVVTLTIYAHLINPVNQEAACKLEKTIFGTGSKMVAETKKEVNVISLTP